MIGAGQLDKVMPYGFEGHEFESPTGGYFASRPPSQDHSILQAALCICCMISKEAKYCYFALVCYHLWISVNIFDLSAQIS